MKACSIVAIGDSLTEGYGVAEKESYPALLQQKLQTDGYPCTVINAGISGELSSGVAFRLDYVLQKTNPDIVILETGINDGLQGFDVQGIEATLDGILQRLKIANITVLFVGMKMVWDFAPDYTRKFNTVYPRLAEKYKVVFMPFFLENVALYPQLNLADGLHPNKSGYQIITENIYPYVKESLERHHKQ